VRPTTAHNNNNNNKKYTSSGGNTHVRRDDTVWTSYPRRRTVSICPIIAQGINHRRRIVVVIDILAVVVCQTRVKSGKEKKNTRTHTHTYAVGTYYVKKIKTTRSSGGGKIGWCPRGRRPAPRNVFYFYFTIYLCIQVLW